MVLWTIFVQRYDDTTVVESFEIDNQENFSSLRNKVAQAFNYTFNDLLITGKEEYNGSFNSKKLSEISGLCDQCTLFTIYQVGGGTIIF